MEITFIPEDGTGKSDATTYVDVFEMKQYFYNIGYSYEGLTDDDIKRILNKASAYIDNNYRNGFPGYRQTEVQSKEFPRIGAYYIDGFPIDESVVPKEIKDAVNETAYLISTGVDISETISKSGQVIKESSKVDVIQESLTYQEGTTMYTDIYTSVDDALSRITGGVSDSFTLSVIRVAGESP